MKIFGPKWPLKRGSEDTYETYHNLKDQVNFYLKNLILTSPGENISAPFYGVGLRRFLFEQNTEEIRNEIEQSIRFQISTYLSYIKVHEIMIDADPETIDSNMLKIKLK